MASEARERKAGHISRRAFLAGMGATAVAGTVTNWGGVPAVLKGGTAEAQQRFEGKPIRILTWTDATGRAAVEHIAKPFEATTGAKVIADLTGATSEMVAKVKASRAKPQYDVIILSMVGAIELANQGLLEKPDPEKLPNLSRVIPHLRSGAHGFGVGYLIWTTGLIYSKKVFTRPPDTWEALWDKRHAGKIFLPAPHWAMAMELTVMAARLAGGNERNPEPGFKKLAELKGRVLTLGESPAQIAELFRTGSLEVGGVYAPPMLIDFIPKPEYAMGAALGELKEGFFYDLQLMVIPKGHPGDSDVTYAFVNYALDPTVQGRMAEAVWYAPINQDVVLSPAAKQNPYIVSPAVAAAKGITIDKEYLATVRAEWIKRYTEIFGS